MYSRQVQQLNSRINSNQRDPRNGEAVQQLTKFCLYHMRTMFVVVWEDRIWDRGLSTGAVDLSTDGIVFCNDPAAATSDAAVDWECVLVGRQVLMRMVLGVVHNPSSTVGGDLR